MTDGEIIALAKSLGWNTEHTQTNHMLILFAKEVAAAEREECARVCDVEIARVKPIYSVTAENCAKAIRSRSD